MLVRRYFSDMVIGFLRNEAASLILQGLDVSAPPAEPGELSAVSEPMFKGVMQCLTSGKYDQFRMANVKNTCGVFPGSNLSGPTGFVCRASHKSSDATCRQLRGEVDMHEEAGAAGRCCQRRGTRMHFVSSASAAQLIISSVCNLCRFTHVDARCCRCCSRDAAANLCRALSG